MKKLLALLLALCMVLGMAACADKTDNAKDSQGNQDDSQGGQTDNAEANDGGTGGKPSGEGGSVESVALILPGVITDESWNYTAYEGLMELQTAGYEVAYVENTDTSNCEAVALNYVSEGYDLIIAHGSQFGDAMIRVAETYPDNYFFVYGKAPVDDYSDNIGFVDTAVYRLHRRHRICRPAEHEERLYSGRGGGQSRHQRAVDHDRQHGRHCLGQRVSPVHDRPECRCYHACC